VAAVLLSAQNVTSLVDQDKVARELGVNTDKDDVAALASRKEADTMKAALVDAYSAASSAILDRVKLLSMEIEGKGGVPTATSASASASGPATGEVPSSTSAVSAETVTVTSPSVSSSSSAPSPSLSSSSPSLPDSVAEAKATPAAVSDLIEKRTQALRRDFDAACKQLQRWDDLNSDKHWLLCISRMKVKNQWGSALKKINDLASSSADNKSKGEAVSREVLNEVPGPTRPMHCALCTINSY
jgi:hypothetical protein